MADPIDALEKHQDLFERLRREYHRKGDHDGQRAMEFALEQIRLVQSETPRVAHSKSEFKRLTAQGADVLPPVAPSHVAQHFSDADIRRMWRAAGGDFHGPNVETATMPEANLFRWLREFADVAAKGATLAPSSTPLQWAEVEKAKADAYEDAARRVEKLSEDYHHEHGSYDESTNAWEIGHRHGDRIEAWDDAVEAIRKRKAEKCQVTQTTVTASATPLGTEAANIVLALRDETVMSKYATQAECRAARDALWQAAEVLGRSKE